MDALRSKPILALAFYLASIPSAFALLSSACICQHGKPCQTSEGIICTHHHHKDLHVHHQEQAHKLHRFHATLPSYPHFYSAYHAYHGLYGPYGEALPYSSYGVGAYGSGALHPLNHPYHPLYHPVTNPYHPYSSTYHPYHMNRIYHSYYPFRAYRPYGEYHLRNLHHPYHAYQPFGTINTY